MCRKYVQKEQIIQSKNDTIDTENVALLLKGLLQYQIVANFYQNYRCIPIINWRNPCKILDLWIEICVEEETSSPKFNEKYKKPLDDENV